VRYRYDEKSKKRFKTVEFIVAESAWDPDGGKWQADRLVPLRVTVTEVALRQQVKRVGGKWNPQRGVWEVRYDHVRALGLTDRIVANQASI
jgi:2-polyprenyl-3-methyl-5-hydroxy-6-metoxy-1,4-benzoquinol methylase